MSEISVLTEVLIQNRGLKSIDESEYTVTIEDGEDKVMHIESDDGPVPFKCDSDDEDQNDQVEVIPG